MMKPLNRAKLTGLFIALEGGEGAGKTSLAAELGKRLTESGYDVLVTREPGATDLGQRLRQIWLDHNLAKDDMDGMESLFLFAADRHAHVRQVVLPALEAGRIVITDRYVFSAKAYQASEGVPADIVNDVCDLATYRLLPKRTYWLDVTPEVGLRRISAQNREETASKYDLASLSFHENVRGAFRDLWQEMPERIMRIDADRAADKVFSEIYADLQNLLRAWKGPRR
ncbi:MAG TPA: dTMP kinase [Candidatus Saccharimonadia bacterium]|jgi:dTMP kinase|nr:dTMP kinase [Candidatus Saccharimonadia bacterium]